MSAPYEDAKSLAQAMPRGLRGARTTSASIEPVLLFGMFGYRAASLGGCVQFQITKITKPERICDLVILRAPVRVTIGERRAADVPKPCEGPLRWM
jgi:hypothetical protein